MSLFYLGASWLTDLWMNIWIWINSLVYQLIEWLYVVFESVANINLFSREAFDDITSRLYGIIGIAMLFIFAYNIILMIVNPDDKKSTGNTTKIVKETIIALVLIILLPRIFNYMSVFQKNLLDSHIIEQIIMGNVGGTENDCDFSEYELINSYVKRKDNTLSTDFLKNECMDYNSMSPSKKGAYIVAPTLFTAFFHPTNYGYDQCVNYLKECKDSGTSCSSSDGLIATDDDRELCAHFVHDVNEAKFNGGINVFVTDDGFYSHLWAKQGLFDFNYIMALVAGCLVVYMFLCYCLRIGVRVAKLGFLQIISPIPVLLRIIPKQKEAVYDKWFKELVNAYLDVFIRLAIIYFAMFAITLVPDVMKSLFSSLNSNWFVNSLAGAIVILGILQFAQEAPDLLKQFFSFSGNFALKSPAQQLKENKYAKGIVGAGGALAAAGVKTGMNAVNYGKQLKEDWDNASTPEEKRKIVGKTALKGVMAPFRAASEGVTAARSGFKNAEDAENWDELREGTYKAAKEAKTKPTIGQKFMGFVGAEWGDMHDFYTGDYSPINSEALLRSAEKLDKTAEALKALEDKLDSTDGVKATKQSFDAIRKQIEDGIAVKFNDKDGNAYTFPGTRKDADGNEIRPTAEEIREAMEKLIAAEKVQVGKARAEAYKKAQKEGDIDVISLAEKYKEEVRKNVTVINKEIDEINKVREANGEGTIDNVEVENLEIQLTSNWKAARQGGKTAGEIASRNRRKAFEKKKETGKK